MNFLLDTILLTKTTAVQNEVALSYYRVSGLYFLVVVFAATIVHTAHCAVSTANFITSTSSSVTQVRFLSEASPKVFSGLRIRPLIILI